MDTYDDELEDDTLLEDLEDGVISEDELAELDLLDEDLDELGSTFENELAEDDLDEDEI